MTTDTMTVESTLALLAQQKQRAALRGDMDTIGGLHLAEMAIHSLMTEVDRLHRLHQEPDAAMPAEAQPSPEKPAEP